jgi:SPP1 gp7 family putative phage head morphogenesis protein
VDEWRQINKLPTLPDGKGKILYVPVNSTPVDIEGESIVDAVNEARAQNTTSTLPKGNGTPTQSLGDNTTGDKPQSEKPTSEEAQNEKKKYKALTLEQKDSMWYIIDKAAIKGEKSFEKKMQSFFEGQQERFQKKLSRGKSIQLKTPDDIVDMFNWKDEDMILTVDIKPEWETSFKEGAKTVNELYQFELDDKLLNPRFLDWVNEYGAEQVQNINETTKKSLQETISEGIRQGEGQPELANRVTAVFDVAKGSRARLIARTETHNSVGAGTFETYKAAGLTQKEWLSTSDARTRDSHVRINREVVDINKKFSNGLKYPGDGNGPPEEVCNCRCTLLPVIPD